VEQKKVCNIQGQPLSRDEALHFNDLLRQEDVKEDAIKEFAKQSPLQWVGAKIHAEKIRPGKVRYQSPELFGGQEWDPFANDVFAMGVILYIMAVGCSPFKLPQKTDAWFDFIYSGAWLNPRKGAAVPYSHLSSECLDLLNKIFKPQEERITIDAMFRHPWILSYSPSQDLT
jgi:serine/threonine protein kinase